MYIGVDLGGSFIKIGLLDNKFNILNKQSTQTPIGKIANELCNCISKQILKILKNTNTKISEITAIGIACPGVTDSKNGILLYPPNLNMRNFNIVNEMKKYFNVPIYIENDSNCAAICQFHNTNKTKDISNMVLLTIGTGIGGGIIINKKLYKGNGLGGEIGHMKISLNGKKCSCKKHGCFEAYASASALIKQTKSAIKKHPDCKMAKYINSTGEKPTGKTVFDFAKQHDPVAVLVVNKYINDFLATGISNIINMLSPQAIYISGGISNESDYLLIPLKQAVNQKALIPFTTDILICDDLNDAGIIGAALICSNHYSLYINNT